MHGGGEEGGRGVEGGGERGLTEKRERGVGLEQDGLHGGGGGEVEGERERTDREKRERGRVGTGWIAWRREEGGGRGRERGQTEKKEREGSGWNRMDCMEVGGGVVEGERERERERERTDRKKREESGWNRMDCMEEGWW